MKITEKDVDYVAGLANLDLATDERARMVRDLNSILEHIETLNELDTANVTPMTQGGMAQSDGSREDVLEGLRKMLPHDLAMANAPDTDGKFFRVPKVIER